MGFNGGGGGALPAHEHTNIVNDGGPLDMNNATVGSLNAGSVVYSDGAALQELAIGAASDQLRVNAGVSAPEWFTPAAGGSDVEFIERFGLASGSAASSMSSSTFSGMSELWAWFQIHNADDNVSVEFRPNNVSTGYQSQARNFAGGNTTSTTGFHYRTGTDHIGLGCAHLMSGNGSYGQFGMTCSYNWTIWSNGGAVSQVGESGGMLSGNTDLITSLTVYGGGSNIYGDVVIFGSAN